ncbi:MAG: aminotransferase class I/II-fold pyridoxal phosphate-dependent enzyme [Elusimicrobiota bacterium]
MTPIFQTAAFRSGDPFFYTRSDNPNFREVEELFAFLDGGAGAVLFASGMAAVDAVLGLLKPGDRMAAHPLIYGCSYRLIVDHCARLGIRLDFADLSKTKALHSALHADTKIVFFETPTNPFLKSIDIRRLAEAVKVKSPRALVVADNTWATPLFQTPLALGADIALYSCSKFFSGHSDLILGAATAKDKAVLEMLRKRRFYSGAVPDPFAAWLLRRSLQTLEVRLRRQVENTRRILSFLKRHPAVREVFFPRVDGTQLKAYGGMLFLRLDGDPDGRKADALADALRLFDRGTALACVSSAVAIPYTGSHLSMTEAEKAGIGLDKSLVRLSIGLEAAEDLIADLKRALKARGRNRKP